MDDEAVKPSDWLDDEEELTPDPSAERPDDWDDVSAAPGQLLLMYYISTLLTAFCTGVDVCN